MCCPHLQVGGSGLWGRVSSDFTNRESTYAQSARKVWPFISHWPALLVILISFVVAGVARGG